MTTTGDTAIVVIEPDGTIMHWNAEAEALFGYPASDAVGRSVEMLIPERYRSRHRAGLARAVAKGETRAGDGLGPVARLPIVCADRVIRRFAGRQTVLKDARRRVIGVVGLFTEPTADDDATMALYPVGDEEADSAWPDVVRAN